MSNKRLMTTEERFWPKVDVVKVDGLPDKSQCWPWVGRSKTRGRGLFKVGGKLRYASHVARELVFGPIPAGLFVLHSCDNPICVNPYHLFVGTQQDNVDDMRRKGRQNYHPFEHPAALRERAVQLYRSGLSSREAARLTGVSFQSVLNWVKASGQCA